MCGLQIVFSVCLAVPGVPLDPPNVQVWFEAVGENAVSGVAQQGAPGQDLQLAYDTSSGPFSYAWDVSMKMIWDTGSLSSAISSQATDFLGDTNALSVADFTSGDYPWSGTRYLLFNTGGFLAETKGVCIPVGPGPIWQPPLPGIYTAFTMRLMADGLQGDLSANGIDARINSLLWTFAYDPAGPLGPGAMVQFGDALPVAGNVQGTVVEDVITFHNIPEPVTAVLMIGCLVLSRPQRRSAR